MTFKLLGNLFGLEIRRYSPEGWREMQRRDPKLEEQVPVSVTYCRSDCYITYDGDRNVSRIAR